MEFLIIGLAVVVVLAGFTLEFVLVWIGNYLDKKKVKFPSNPLFTIFRIAVAIGAVAYFGLEMSLGRY